LGMEMRAVDTSATQVLGERLIKIQKRKDSLPD